MTKTRKNTKKPSENTRLKTKNMVFRFLRFYHGKWGIKDEKKRMTGDEKWMWDFEDVPVQLTACYDLDLGQKNPTLASTL